MNIYHDHQLASKPISQLEELARHMAHIAHSIRDLTVTVLEQHAASRMLRDLYEVSQKVLLPDLTIPQFADMFAQTLIYGLFAARYTHNDTLPFSRQHAISIISHTDSFLNMLFDTITEVDQNNANLIKTVDDLMQLLAKTDIRTIMADFEALVHFYEMFLAQYNPELRESHSVYYTPQPVISYIVRSVDLLLRSRFGCQDGLADTSTIPYLRTDE